MCPRIGIGAWWLDTYLTLAAVGIIVGSMTTCHLAVRCRLSLRHFLALIAGVLLVGMLGAHGLHVAVSWEHYRDRPLHLLAFWQGRAFIGGPVAGLLFGIAYTRWFRLPF